METYYRYLIISSISIAVLYLAYHSFFRKVDNFKKIRLFLLSALMFSLLLPFSPASINLSDYQIFNSSEQLTFSKKNETVLKKDNAIYDITEVSVKDLNPTNFIHISSINYFKIITTTYFMIAGLLILRLLLSIVKMMLLYSKADKKLNKNYTLILLDKRIIAFSFFKWIFIDKSIGNQDFNQIIAHEKAHADQCHTFDLLISELLVAAMWFNPFVWMFKKALTQVHEYLADEQVLDSGCNRIDYQRLLVNQAAEERLVAVSSNFSYSLIKKRIMMMQKTKTHAYSGMKFLAVIPIIVVLIFSVAVFNQPVNAKTKSDALHTNNHYAIRSIKNTKNETSAATLPTKDETSSKKITEIGVPPDTIPKHKTDDNELIAAISPTKMNVLYIGVDNPVSIAVTGAQKDKIKASISNGTIAEENGQYIVRVKQLGKANITVSVDNKVVFNQEFRVKRVPDPVAMVAGRSGGTVTIGELIDAGEVKVILQNFDFDLRFEVVSFNLSAIIEGGIVADERQNNGSHFTSEQIDLIKKMQSNRKIYIENIKAKGPDGTIRDLGTLTFKIK